MSRTDLQQALIAIAALLAGISVYLYARPPATTYFAAGLQPTLDITVYPELLLAHQLPSFLHTYAFILLTYVVIGMRNRKALCASIMLWLMLELLFELGQMPLAATLLAALTPDWFSDFYVLELIDTFFTNGTCDAFDVLAILLAAPAAWWTVRISHSGEDFRDEH